MLILASQSPRRKELLSKMSHPFIQEAADTDEVFDPSLPVDEALIQVASAKAEAVQKNHPDDSILAADTIVYDSSSGRILGKPQDLQEAFETLKSLSGRWHEVKTAVVLLNGQDRKAESVTTRVHFKDLDDQKIRDYVNQKSCLDKAGSYGIQETDFVDQLEGSFSNVVGLPVETVQKLLNLHS